MMKYISTLSLLILLSTGNLQSKCDGCNLDHIPNGDFETLLQCTTLPIPPFPGFSYFPYGCVADWDHTGSPDLFTPTIGFTYLDQYFGSNIGALCYYWQNPHSETLISDNLNLNTTDQDVHYNLELDIAAVCIENQNPLADEQATQIKPGQIEIELTGTTSTIAVDNISLNSSYDIVSGWQRKCYDIDVYNTDVDPGNAHIVITSINDPNYPCRNVILRIDNTQMEFTKLSGYDANSGALLNCLFTEECN